MTLPNVSRRILLTVSAAALLFASCRTAPTTPAPTPAAAHTMGPTPRDPLATLTYAGPQDLVESLDRDIAAAGNDAGRLASLVHRLLAIAADHGATFGARQVACQRLSELPAEFLTAGDAQAVFAAMLLDPQDANLARLAIERKPGAEFDALFLQAAAQATGLARVAVIQSLGNRHVAGAVPLVATALADGAPEVSVAAAKALGQIGANTAAGATLDSPAVLALLAAPDGVRPAATESLLTIAAAHPGAAAGLLNKISDEPNVPAALRAVAQRALILNSPASAPTEIVAILSGSDAMLKPVVLEAVLSLESPGLVEALSDKLGAFDRVTQVAVITALGRRGDSAAVGAVSRATDSADAEIRSAAIEALGRLPGSPETALLLAHIAASGNVDDAKLARQSLARLNGPDVATTIVHDATEGPAATRVVFLETIASRNLTEAIPELLNSRHDPDASIRSAALGALTEIGGPSEQSALVDWSLGATDPAEQSRALRALASATLRNPDATHRSDAIMQAIEATAPDVAARTLPVLARIGGVANAESTGRLALRDEPALATAATTSLARWNDATALPTLVNVAEKTTSDKVRTTATQGALRLLERNPHLDSTEMGTMISRLIKVATEPDTRVQLVRLLGRTADAGSLATAESLRGDALLGTEAAEAGENIKSNQQGSPRVRVSGNTGQAELMLDGKLNTSWAVPATAGQWIELGFAAKRAFHRVTLDANNPYNYPERIDVYVTDDPQQPGALIVSAAGTPGKTTIELPHTAHGRYLILRHPQGRTDSWWSVAELQID